MDRADKADMQHTIELIDKHHRAFQKAFGSDTVPILWPQAGFLRLQKFVANLKAAPENLKQPRTLEGLAVTLREFPVLGQYPGGELISRDAVEVLLRQFGL